MKNNKLKLTMLLSGFLAICLLPTVLTNGCIAPKAITGIEKGAVEKGGVVGVEAGAVSGKVGSDNTIGANNKVQTGPIERLGGTNNVGGVVYGGGGWIVLTTFISLSFVVVLCGTVLYMQSRKYSKLLKLYIESIKKMPKETKIAIERHIQQHVASINNNFTNKDLKSLEAIKDKHDADANSKMS